MATVLHPVFNAAAGFPSNGSFSGKPDKDSGRVLRLYGADHAEKALLTALSNMPKALEAALTELGLFGERETKLRTPVQFGLLRASIGHYDASMLAHNTGAPSGETEAEAKARKKLEKASSHGAEMAVFEVDKLGKSYKVTWGTNVEYGPYIEDGFTMSSRRLVYIWNVGFRWVDPFSYRGAHMFEQGLQAVASAAEPILAHWVKAGLEAAGVS